MEWVRVWRFELWFRTAQVSPWNAVYYATHLRTAEGVRRWRERALANPDVERYKVTAERKLEGDYPQRCPAGHPYHHGFSTIFGRHEWLVCQCGGHMLFKCDAEHCPNKWTPDPPLAIGCTAVSPLPTAEPDQGSTAART